MTRSELKLCADCRKPEEWRPVTGYEDLYRISNHGRVWALPKVVVRRNGRLLPMKERILRPGAWGSGHLFVILHRDKVQDRRGVHRLVLEGFVGPCPEGHECLHSDDCPTHNHRANLRWGTRSQNCVDRRRTRGKVVPWAKLTPAQVRAIRASDLTQRELAAIFGVCQPTIHAVVAGKTHRDVRTWPTGRERKGVDVLTTLV